MSDDKDVHPMIAVADAVGIILHETARSLLQHESIPNCRKIGVNFDQIASLVNEVLDDDLLMQDPGYPPYQASMMDGYCIRLDDDFAPENVGTSTQEKKEMWSHYIAGKQFAGDTFLDSQESLPKHEGLLPAYYVTTGAMIPRSFDCVIPIEDILVADSKDKILVLRLPSTPAKWIREVGCDIKAGSIVLPAGHILDPVSLGLLKQSGQTTIRLRPKVHVGVLSTGSELLDDWHLTIDGVQGKIPDVNRPILIQLLRELNLCEVSDFGSCRDDDSIALACVIQEAMKKCKVIVITGGISMGETDIVEDILIKKLGGTLHFGRIHMKPGKPSTFVTIPGPTTTHLVFALPGNPVSAFVCAHLLVRPCLQLLHEGAGKSFDTAGVPIHDCIRKIISNATLAPAEIVAQLSHDIVLDSERPEYHRVRLNFDVPKNAWIATSTGVQRSSRLMSLRDADALLVLPQAVPPKTQAFTGERFPALLLKSMLIPKQSVSQSRHMKSLQFMCAYHLDIVIVGESSFFNTVADIVSVSLSGVACNSMMTSSLRNFDGKARDIFDFVTNDKRRADIYVVIGSNKNGSMYENAIMSSIFRSRLRKVSRALAFQVRRDFVAESPRGALVEPVLGFIDREPSSLLIYLPLFKSGGLANISELVGHAFKTAQMEISTI